MPMFFSVFAVVATTSIAAAQDVSGRPGTTSTPLGTTERTVWDIYLSIRVEKEGHVGMLVGTVEAATEGEAIEKASCLV
jgi:hypothetical protein